MRKLFYATFEKGFGEIVQKVIKKFDGSARVKKMYADSVIFFADEKFNFANNIFTGGFLVFDNIKKEGIGSINAEMKHLLERKDLKIQFPSSVKKFKLTFLRSSDRTLIDQNLRKALEVMLQKVTKKKIGYFDADAELILISKEDGECMLVKKLDFASAFSKLDTFGTTPQTAFALNFLSCPEEKEVSLDPFSENGIISFVRSLSFKRANVIANSEFKENVLGIKKLAKSLKDRAFSVLNYDFLSEDFPIRFIDKIVTRPPNDKEVLAKFIEKCYNLNVPKVVIISKSRDVFMLCKGKFDIEEEYAVFKEKIFVLKLKK